MAHDHSNTGLADLLDLDAEVLHAFHDEVMTAVASAAGAPRRIADLGAGSGTGAFALARRFPDAEILAVDMSDDMLDHLLHRAGDLRPRIRPVLADLDRGWPADVTDLDLAWASASMHHVADPERVLTDVRAALRPGGVFAVVELASFPRFLPDEAGGGVVGRAHDLVDRLRSHDLPTMGSDWGSRLAAAGFTVETARHFEIDLTDPLPPAAGRFARATFQRLRTGLADRLTGAEVGELDRLIDGIEHREDLTVRTTRSLWIGRRTA